MYAEVAILSGHAGSFQYVVPSAWLSQLKPGIRVMVPLRTARALGVVARLSKDRPMLPHGVSVKPIEAVLDEAPLFSEDLLYLCQWMSRYYFHPLGAVFRSALPPSLLQKPPELYRIREGVVLPIESVEPESHLLLSWFMERKGPVSLPRIRRECGVGRSVIQRLVRKGWVVRTYGEPRRIPPSKRVKAIRKMKEIPPDRLRRSSNLRRLWEMLSTASQPVPCRDLRNLITSFDYWIKALSRDGFVEVVFMQEIRDSNLAQVVTSPEPKVLTDDQQRVLSTLGKALDRGEFSSHLLYGITGSGKTEVYLQLTRKVREKGGGVLILVPEIALSTQMEGLFRQRFGRDLAVWHSALSAGARDDQWRMLRSGERRILLGVRSAVLGPVENLRLIIVDEEHDSSYKQEDRLRYNARDAAIVRARHLGIPILLGSATPSLQSIHHVRTSRYQLTEMLKRVENRILPRIEVVDMKREKGRHRLFSKNLYDAMTLELAEGQQVLLFLNRRGFATFSLCRICGRVLECRFCSVSMTLHQSDGRLHCHYCGFTCPVPDRCPSCGHEALLTFGCGTERVEAEVRRLFPGVAVVRLDRDVVKSPLDLVTCLESVRKGEAQVLVGTQMVVKGHDFGGITLVGVVNADVSLQIPDFRSGETTVQLLMQVAGRTGRGCREGRVIIQSYNPQHYTIRSLAGMDYMKFADEELQSRKSLQYPPFTKMSKLIITESSVERCREMAQALARVCRRVSSSLAQRDCPAVVLGPAPAPIQRVKGKVRWHLYLKTWRSSHMQRLLEMIFAKVERHSSLRRRDIQLDRDPLSSF